MLCNDIRTSIVFVEILIQLYQHFYISNSSLTGDVFVTN